LPKYVVSKAAESDMTGIALHTKETWGTGQAVRYISSLRDRFQFLADNPGMGRTCDSVSAGLHRYEQGKHVIFFRVKPGSIRVVRVLHQRMLPMKSRFEA
jgi:toxin ParE1/3/4